MRSRPRRSDFRSHRFPRRAHPPPWLTVRDRAGRSERSPRRATRGGMKMASDETKSPSTRDERNSVGWPCSSFLAAPCRSARASLKNSRFLESVPETVFPVESRILRRIHTFRSQSQPDRRGVRLQMNGKFANQPSGDARHHLRTDAHALRQSKQASHHRRNSQRLGPQLLGRSFPSGFSFALRSNAGAQLENARWFTKSGDGDRRLRARPKPSGPLTKKRAGNSRRFATPACARRSASRGKPFVPRDKVGHLLRDSR